MAQVQQVPPIARGYAYAVQLDVSSDSEPFPAGCSLRAQVANYPGAPVGAPLSTAAGTIVRVDDHNVILNLSPAMTALLSNTSAVIDLVRDDVSPEQWLAIQLTLRVIQPVTAP